MNVIDVEYQELNYEDLEFLPTDELIDLVIEKDQQVQCLLDYIKEEKNNG